MRCQALTAANSSQTAENKTKKSSAKFADNFAEISTLVLGERNAGPYIFRRRDAGFDKE